MKLAGLLLISTLGLAQEFDFDPCISGGKPFYFSMAVAEGNYRVTVSLGHAERETDTTIKAELRRLMVEKVQSAPSNKYETRTFIVNVRTPKLPAGGAVNLKDRELGMEAAAWDEKLTREFNGKRPTVCGLKVEPAGDIPTIYLAGDSTMTDQPCEPFTSWGQMLPRFFKPEVAIANHGESGESLHSFLSEKRLEKISICTRPLPAHS